ncbi:MAG: hypothetical protein CME59_05645 [Halioglobus sp.]|nr:hypothetical protein [Halioglobus sp.]|tara:strand:- start:3807 stop:4412 length:606 start_codon:yes stop_codon:yes gene_type:complete
MTQWIHRTARYLALLPLLGLLAACASGPPRPEVDYKPDYDFSPVKKIALYRDSGKVVGDNPLQLSDIQRGRIDDALAFALGNRGFTVVDDAAQADLLMSWHLVTQHKTDVRTWNTPAYGYGGYYGRYNRYSAYNCWNCRPMTTEVSVSNYTQGTFIVDLIDPDMRRSVWRAVTQSRLKSEPSQDQAHYNEAATAIFASFPP